MTTAIIKLYKQMADLTAPECATVCRAPHSCCSSEYCDMAQEIAKDLWSEDISSLRTTHPTLPFMGPTGCVVAPHHRPMCTMHTCAIGGVGFKPGDAKWTKEYFALRKRIEKAEYKR